MMINAFIINSSAVFGLDSFGRKEARTDNSGFKKLAVQWLQQVQFSNGTFVVADSLVLRNRQLLKPTNRWPLPATLWETANIKQTARNKLCETTNLKLKF